MKSKMLMVCMAALGLCITTTTKAADVPKSLMSRVSVETIGAMRHVDFKGKAQWGAGVAGLFEFNPHVYGFARALSYKSPDNWGGSVIDETTAGVEAVVWSKSKLSLSALGGVTRSFAEQDWGFGLGLAPAVELSKNVTLFVSGEVRLWDEGENDVLTTFGLNFRF